MQLTRNIFAALDVCSHPADNQRREVDIMSIVITRPLVSLPLVKMEFLHLAVNQSARRGMEYGVREENFFVHYEEFFDFVKKKSCGEQELKN